MQVRAQTHEWCGTEKHNLQQRDRPARKTNRPAAKGKSQPSRASSRPPLKGKTAEAKKPENKNRGKGKGKGKDKDKKQKPKAKSGDADLLKIQKKRMIRKNHVIRKLTMSLLKPVRPLRIFRKRRCLHALFPAANEEKLQSESLKPKDVMKPRKAALYNLASSDSMLVEKLKL